jgi:uncharacterized DUF497 family protein
MFVWNESKRKQVIEQHGVDFAEIEDIFEDAFSIDFIDEEHSTNAETRYGVIGKTAGYGLVILIYTAKDEQIRFITARRAEKWMVNDYEQQEKRY